MTSVVRFLASVAAALALAVVAENAVAQSVPGDNPGLAIQSTSAVILVADPDDGFFVESWSVDCENADSAGRYDDTNRKRCVLSAPVPGGVSVFFAPVFYPFRTVNIDSATNGRVVATVAGAEVRDGETAASAQPVTFSAVPASDGYYVSVWTGACENIADAETGETDPAGTTQTCVVPADDSPVRVGAMFAEAVDCEPQNRIQTGATCGNCVPRHFGQTCELGRQLVLKATPNGTLFAEWSGGSGLGDGEYVPRQAVTLSADPDPEYYVKSWIGDFCQSAPIGADDLQTGLAKQCAVPAVGAISVSVAFERLRDCLSQNRRHTSVSACGECNRAGFFALSPEAACQQGREVVLGSSGDGTLSAEWSGGDLQSGDIVPAATAVTLSANPGADDYVSEWTGDCASAPTGRDDRDPGADKTCVVPAGTSTLSASVAFVPAKTDAECGSQNRFAGESVSQCGECKSGHFAESEDAACVQGHRVDLQSVSNGTFSASWNGMNLNQNDLVPLGSAVTLSANPADGYYVSAWTGCASTPENTGDDMDGDPKTCELVTARGVNPIWGVTFQQQGLSEAQRITTADLATYCVNESNEAGTVYLDKFGYSSPSGTEFWYCAFYGVAGKSCYSLAPGAVLAAGTLLFHGDDGAIDRADTCDSVHPECGTGQTQRITGNPLSGCVAEE